MVKDRFNNELKIGDEIEYVTVYGHSPNFNKGEIVNIDPNRRYGDIIQVLGNKNQRPGWTYPYRILKLDALK